MKVNVYYFMALSGFFLLCCLICCQPLPAQLPAERLNDQIPVLMEKAAVPGLSLAVIHDREIGYAGGFGQRSSDTGGRVDETTVFSAASLSKPVFAFAVLQLMEEGLFDIDRPLCEYLVYEDAAHDERYRQITARMVLTHTSGFPNWRRDQLEIQFSPGEKFSYSGEGFVFLMKVIEKVSGRSTEEMMQERVFRPLGMVRSSYVWQPAFEENHAIPHGELGRTASLRRFETANTAYSLQTTAADYARFVIAILNAEGLKRETVIQMLSPQVQVPTDDQKPENFSEKLSWGLGFGLQETNRGKAFWHWGDNGTFRCFVMVLPGSGSGMVYFTNSYNGLSIMEEMTRLCLSTDLPALEMLNYLPYDHPASQLLAQIIEKGYEQATTPLLAENGRHLNPDLLNERAVNRVGYQLLRQGHFEAARQVFGSNVRAFPESANAYDSYGEVCLRSGDLREAEKYYQLALEKDPQNETAAAIVRQLTETPRGNQTFSLQGYENASFVGLAGEFNDWNPLRNPMRWRNGQWECRLDLFSGEYEYKLMVDGIWILDPANPASIYSGGHHNSVIEIK